jgi:uncharacterized protein YecE (DUF72 family)
MTFLSGLPGPPLAKGRVTVMQLHVGQSTLRGDIARYARRFDLVELRAEPGKLPRPKQLREWTKRVPERFVFSVVLPRIVGTLDLQPGFDDALQHALASAEALGAKWLILQTPHGVMPSTRTRRRLSDLMQRLPRETLRIGWEPRGVWQDDETEQLASELGMFVVRDLSRQPPAPANAAYCRLLALGEGLRVRAGAVERVFENLTDFEDAYVVIEGEGAVRAVQLLRELSGAEILDAGEDSDAGDDDDGESDDGDEPEEMD